MSSMRESWERFRQRRAEVEAQPPPDHPLHFYGFVWAGLGALFGAVLGAIGPTGTDDAAVNGAMIGAGIGFALGITVNALTMPRGRRWVALVVGVALVVVNIFPEPSFRGGYYWPADSRLLLAIGVVLVLFALLTAPKDESF